MNYYVYIIVSLKNGKRYVGFTSRSVEERLSEHNVGKNQWTNENKPFKLLYFEKLTCENCARLREKFSKSGQGRKISSTFNV